MERTVTYRTVKFPASVVEDAYRTCREIVGQDVDVELYTSVEVGDSSWSFDNFDEFLSEYSQPHDQASIGIGLPVLRDDTGPWYLRLALSEGSHQTRVTVQAIERSMILRIFNIFDRVADHYRITPPESNWGPPTIFLGHGRSHQWRDLKDHLHEQHGYPVQAYEIGARAGHAIRDILEEMLHDSSFAILVMTGEDRTSDDQLRARQNVVHETGLFQGRLGFSRAIVLLERGTENYSNLQGVHYIEFSPGNIRETYGDVLATIRREFGAAV